MQEQKKKHYEVAVVGVTFEGRQSILSEMYLSQEAGIELCGRLKREPDNKFDSNAVAVEVNGSNIGYIPKTLAAKLAPRIDDGKPIEVALVRVIRNFKDELNSGGKFVYGTRIMVEEVI